MNLFYLAKILTAEARVANLRVLMVWKKFMLAGDIVQMIAVSELPPSEFWRMRVSLLSR